MGSYGVIKEALLVKKIGQTNEYTVVQKLVPGTVNGVVSNNQNDGFEVNGVKCTISSINHGGAFGFTERPGGNIIVTVNIPGYGVKMFTGAADVHNVNGIGACVICVPNFSIPNAPFTHLCLVVKSPVSLFEKN